MVNFAWQQIPDTIISEILCNTGFDGVILDAEHSNFSADTLFRCIQTIKLSGKKCGVRFTCADEILVRSCLDAGVDYAIFSTVEDLDYCEKIISMCKYPRYGGKRGQGLVRENMWGRDELNKKDVKIVAMIESKDGVEMLPFMVSKKIDFFLIGMYDLSASLGCIGDFENEIFKKYLKCFENQVSKERAGIHLVRNYKDFLKSNIKDYFSFIAMGMDTTVLLDSYNRVFNSTLGK